MDQCALLSKCPSYNLTDFLYQRCWTTTNRSSPLSEYSHIVRSSICLTFIEFRRCTKIHINIDSLRVYRSVRPSLYPFFSKNCLHILSKVFRSTTRQPTQEVGSFKSGSSRIQNNYYIILNLQISTLSQTSSLLISRPFTQPFLTRKLKAG